MNRIYCIVYLRWILFICLCLYGTGDFWLCFGKVLEIDGRILCLNERLPWGKGCKYFLFPLVCSSCRNNLTWSCILGSSSSNSMHMSTISPLSLSISLRIKCVMTINACLLTLFFLSCNNINMSLVLSCRVLGNLLNKSPREIIILAFTPNSKSDFRSYKIKSRCY